MEGCKNPLSRLSGHLLYDMLRSRRQDQDPAVMDGAAMIMDVYARLTGERELKDGSNLDKFTQSRFAS